MSAASAVFLDTNVLVYARDRSELVKGPHAQNLLSNLFAAGQPILSAQVLCEFFWTTTRKLPLPLTETEATAEVHRLIALTRVLPISVDLVEKALELVAAHGLPLWDAQILAAAVLSRASTVLSEDFSHRQTLEGVTFLNPFASDFDPNQILGP
jgi:predicted nucleic acid-binding protein